VAIDAVAEGHPSRSFYLAVAPIYFVGVGILFAWGYWSPFGVNILEFIDAYDVLRLTAYHVATTFVFVLIGATLGELTIGDVLPRDGGNSAAIQFLGKYRHVIKAGFLGLLLALVVFPLEGRWRVLPFLAGVPISLAIKGTGALSGVIPNDRVRTVVIFALSVLPLWAYGRGHYQALDVIGSRDYQYLVPNSSEAMRIDDPPGGSGVIKYLGRAGSYTFLLGKDNETVVIVEIDSRQGLRLKRAKSTS